MARFCGNCGKPLEEGAKVCGYCGTPVDENSVRIPLTKTVDPERNGKLRKMGKNCCGIFDLASCVDNYCQHFLEFSWKKRSGK